MKYNIGLTTFTLICISSIINLRNANTFIVMQDKMLFIMAICMLLFFVPCVLVSMNFAFIHGRESGIYYWVKQTLGCRLGLYAAYFQWFENVFYFPLQLSFIISSILTLTGFDADNHMIHFLLINMVFWFTTYIGYLGMNVSGRLIAICTVLGLLIPTLIMFYFSFFLPNIFSQQKFTMPVKSLLDVNLVTQFSFCLAAFMGIEVTAVHARDFARPKKQVPLGIGITAVATMVIMAIVSLIVLQLLSDYQSISINSALVDSFALIMRQWGLANFQPFIVLLIVMGPIAGLTTWVISPVRTLHTTFADQGIFPDFIGAASDAKPGALLLAQGVLVSLLTTSYFVFDMFEIIELMSIALVVIYMLAYFLMFYAALKLPAAQKSQFLSKRAINVSVVLGLLGTVLFLMAGLYSTVHMLLVKHWSKSIFIIAIAVLCFGVPWLLKGKEHA